MSNMIITTRLKTADEVLKHWLLFLEGFSSLNKTCPEVREVDTNATLRLLCHVISLPNQDGLLTVFKKVDNEPIGFVICMNNSDPFRGVRSFNVYAAYSQSVVPGQSQFMLNYTEKWAKENGYEEMQARTFRFSGAARRIFTNKWGFKQKCIVYTKEIK